MRSPLPIASVTLFGSGPGAVGGDSAVQVRKFLRLSRYLSLAQINRISPMDRHDDPEIAAFLRHRCH